MKNITKLLCGVMIMACCSNASAGLWSSIKNGVSGAVNTVVDTVEDAIDIVGDAAETTLSEMQRLANNADQIAIQLGVEVFSGGGNNFAWKLAEPQGAKCSDGSQYRFWYLDRPQSNNLVILYEGGGACWDYDTCAGNAGKLGAVNPEGIPRNYIRTLKAKNVSPIINGKDPALAGIKGEEKLPTSTWDLAYMPYCTGDTHIGARQAVYDGPKGERLEYNHSGFYNSVRSLKRLNREFPEIDKLLITGFSAGGVASTVIYDKARTLLNVKKGYMLNDSGPVFTAPSDAHKSRLMHDTIRTAWNLESVLNQMPVGFDPTDLGSLVGVVAKKYPNDRFAYTGFSKDDNFSRFSYERFYPEYNKDQMNAAWRQDQENLVQEMKRHANYSYMIPWERQINQSHCSTILTFLGSSVCPSVRLKPKSEVEEFIGTRLAPQSWGCPGGDRIRMTQFLRRWINNDIRITAKEPFNLYNKNDVKMQIVAPIINAALN